MIMTMTSTDAACAGLPHESAPVSGRPEFGPPLVARFRGVGSDHPFQDDISTPGLQPWSRPPS